jgi:glucose/arabinose dehydrogenase
MRTTRWTTHLIAIPVLLIAVIGGGLAYFLHGAEAKLTVDEVSGPHPKITDPKQELLPSVHISKVVHWQGDAKPVAAPGLQVQAFATGLDHPRWLLTLPNGDVLVSESNTPAHPVQGFMDWISGILMSSANGSDHSPNKIILLRDTKASGVADQRFTLLEGLKSPSGMAYVDGTLYVANTDALLAYPYKLGDTSLAAKPRKIADLPANLPNMHWARNVIPSEDGKTLYVSVGSNSNIADGGFDAEKSRANVLQIDPKTGETRIYSGGMRNPNGMAFDPKSKAIWVTVNERDMLGPDLPPDFMTRLEFGADYGWPYTFWGGYTDPRIDPNLPDNRLQYFKRPEYALGAHTASLGIVFSNDAKLGPAYPYGVFVAQHGSWNRRPQVGYRVVYIPFEANGYPKAKPVEVLTGFLDKDGNAQGRPVDVVLDKTGALLVSDDAGNRVWRVSAAR